MLDGEDPDRAKADDDGGCQGHVVKPAVAERLAGFLEADRGQRDSSDEAEQSQEANGPNGSCALKCIRDEEWWREHDDQQIEPRASGEFPARRSECKLAQELGAERKPDNPVQSCGHLADGSALRIFLEDKGGDDEQREYRHWQIARVLDAVESGLSIRLFDHGAPSYGAPYKT